MERELQVQFTRIARLQAELDRVLIAFERTSNQRVVRGRFPQSAAAQEARLIE
jgi:hypothetical protein